MHEDNCAVYVHVNLINGKKYFGITVQEPEKRWRNGHGYYNNAHFKNAILKYGWENFGHFVLYKNIPIKIAKNIEEMLIQEHFSYDPRFGYNKTYGGELEKHTKETRRKMSESMNGREVLEETRRKISESMKEYWENNQEAREAKSERMKEYWENNQEAREAMRGENNPNPPKPVEALDQESSKRVFYFKSTMDADRAGFNHSHISACCLGKRKTHAGYIWRHVEEVSDNDSDN